MAPPPPPYHVQDAVENRQKFPQHASVSALWIQKWRKLCQLGVYPFVDGKLEDFEMIFSKLITSSCDSVSVLYDPDAYAAPFFPVAESLVNRAKDAESAEEYSTARDLYLRAAAVYRIARFPINRSTLSEKAWQAGKAAYLAGSRYLQPTNEEVLIPHLHADNAFGETQQDTIAAYLRIPNNTPRPSKGWPVLLFICGLDAYKTDHTNRTTAHLAAGFVTLSVEIPGTGDCPAARNDPTSPDRLFSSILDWIVAKSDQYAFDCHKIVARGVSTGGYYAFRVAHTHADRLFAAVAQGGGCHYMFFPEWIDAQNHMEYPFALADALAYKFGYAGVTEYKVEAGKFSLLSGGLLERDCCRLLIVNGTEDSIFPVEDSALVASIGRVKDLRLQQRRGHMGNPGGDEILLEWIDGIMKGQ